MEYGTLKEVWDCHTHTYFSHDSECDPVDSLKVTEEKGIAGFAVTDHCDIEFCENTDVKTPIVKSTACARQTGKNVLVGVEIGEGIWHKSVARDIINENRFDIVLGSVHAVKYKTFTMPYSTIDFSAFSQGEIEEYLNSYFDDMLEMIETTDFDVLTHLTCPLRYITGKYGKQVDLKIYSEKIEIILKNIIKKNIALEVNTSCLDSSYNSLMPNTDIIKQYNRLGGSLVTLGSDAHEAKRIAYGFDYALEELKKLGFCDIYYYKDRKPVGVEIRI